ncbi:MAG: 6-phosphogluconolactonase [Phycisphaerae bacterium]|nr:6-phosphogluconolactonase [Phycisphaerae bacterium]
MSAQVRPNIEVFSELGDLAQAAASLFVQAAHRALDAKGQFRVALSGGRTPRLLFERLTSCEQARALPWSRCHLFWVDERYVPVTDPASNYKMANEFLLEPLGIPQANIHRMPTELPLDEAVAQYESTLQTVFSILPGEVPQFDLIQLGMGPDGHTASLFPHAYEPHTEKLVAWTVPPDAPHQRITLTPHVLQAASEFMVLLTGKDKASMLKTVFSGEPDVMQYPIYTLWPVLKRVTWFMDQAAASEL